MRFRANFTWEIWDCNY